MENFYREKIYSKVNRARSRAILSWLGPRDKLVLDLGCGDGSLGAMIKEKTGGKVIGLDISPAAAKSAAEKIDRALVFDLENENEWPIEIRELKFSKIVISEVLEHLFAPEKILEKIKNLLAEQGAIIITVPNFLFWKNRIKILFGRFDYEERGLLDRGHIHFFSWPSFKKTIGGRGLEIKKASHHLPTRGTKFLGRFFPVCSPINS